MDKGGAHIDLIFRNGLKEFELLPPGDIWENIRPAVKKNQQSALMILSAAMVAILISIGSLLYLLTDRLTDNLYGPDISLNQDNFPEGTYVARSFSGSGLIGPVRVKTDQSVVSISEPDSRDIVDDFEIIRTKQVSVAPESDNPGVNVSLRDVVSDFSEPEKSNGKGISIDISSGKLHPVNSGSAGKKWIISALASPTYYTRSASGESSSIKEMMNSEKPALSYTGGLSFSYKVSRKLSIQSGLYYSALGQKVSDIASFTGFRKYFTAKSGTIFSVQTSSGVIVSSNTDIYLFDYKAERIQTIYTKDIFDPAKADVNWLTSDLYQKFNYLEVPLLVRYKLIDRKIDLNLTGGLSYNILVANSAYTQVRGVKYYIGLTEGLSPITLSSTMGMGFEYELTKKLSFNFEPTFRYYITPLGGFIGSSIHPFSFGVLSGMSYNF